jgi:hypothetical protein
MFSYLYLYVDRHLTYGDGHNCHQTVCVELNHGLSPSVQSWQVGKLDTFILCISLLVANVGAKIPSK